jgi:lipopolysaccharide transport system ATP-binding protein
MADLSGTGRTVLFVSHSMPSVLRLCPRVLLLDGGHLTADGAGSIVVEEYIGRGAGAAIRDWPDIDSAPGDEHVRLRSVRVVNEAGEAAAEVEIRQPISIEIDYWNLSGAKDFRPCAYIHVRNGEGTFLFASWDVNNVTWREQPRRPGLVHTRCHIPGNLLAEGGVYVSAGVSSTDPMTFHVEEQDAVVFHVVDRSEGDGVRANWTGDFPGVMRPMLSWEVVEEPFLQAEQRWR